MRPSDSNETGLEMSKQMLNSILCSDIHIYILFINDITTFIADYVKDNTRFTYTQEEIK